MERLRGTTEKDMWLTDLEAFEIVRRSVGWCGGSVVRSCA